MLLRVVVGTTALVASTTRAGAAAPARVVGFRVFAAEPVVGVAYAAPGLPDGTPGVVQLLTFFPTVRSARHEHRGVEPMQFVEVATGRLVAEVAVGAAAREVLLVFLREADSGGARRYRVLALEEVQGNGADISIVNLSGMALSAAMNGRRLAVHEGLNAPLAGIGEGALVLHARVNGREYQAFREPVPAAAGARPLLLLFPPLRPGSIEVQSRWL